MKNLCIYAMLTIALAAQGCVGPFAFEEGGWFGPDPWGKPVWGEPAEGVRCRLSVYKRKWKITETPTFTFDLQNNGKRTFAFWPDQKHQFCRIQVDGQWHHWSPTELIDSQVWNVSPGADYKGVILELRQEYNIKIKPGRHVVRIALVLEDVRVVSNPVGIDIVP